MRWGVEVTEIHTVVGVVLMQPNIQVKGLTVSHPAPPHNFQYRTEQDIELSRLSGKSQCKLLEASTMRAYAGIPGLRIDKPHLTNNHAD